jgi:plasmid maintenance system antidote protein VapI
VKSWGALLRQNSYRLEENEMTTPEFWLNLQKNYDLWHAETASKEWQKVKPFPQRILHHNASPYSIKAFKIDGQGQVVLL